MKLFTMERIISLSHQLKLFFERYSLYLILSFAFLVRFIGLNFGLPYLYHPDEPLYVNSAIRTLVRGDLNLHWFCHPGSFIIYLLAILFAIILAVYFIYCLLLGYVHNLADFKQLVKANPIFYYYDNPVLFYFIGRLLMVFFAIITIYLVYLVAKKLFNKPVGLLAAFCLNISPLHLEHSRFIRPDITATMLVMFSLYFLFRFIDEDKNTKWLILSSLFAGFSIAAKYTSGVIIFPILIHCLVNDSKEPGLFTTQYFINSFKIKTNLSRALLFIFIGFFIFAPFVILDFRHALKGMLFIARQVGLGKERLPGIQNHLWYLKKPLQGGIGGLFFEIFAGLGLCFALLRRSYKKYLFLVFPILYFLIVGGTGSSKIDRWIIILLPFEAILFGVGFYGVYKLFIQIEEFSGHKLKVLSLFAIALIYASKPTVIHDIERAISLTRLDTRIIAKDWIENNLPSGSKIVYDEEGGPHFHVNPRGNFTLINMRLKKIVSQPLSYYRKRGVDYIIISVPGIKGFYNEPSKYVKEILRYEELKNETKLIKRFGSRQDPGPKIEIYKLK